MRLLQFVSQQNSIDAMDKSIEGSSSITSATIYFGQNHHIRNVGYIVTELVEISTFYLKLDIELIGNVIH